MFYSGFIIDSIMAKYVEHTLRKVNAARIRVWIMAELFNLHLDHFIAVSSVSLCFIVFITYNQLSHFHSLMGHISPFVKNYYVILKK